MKKIFLILFFALIFVSNVFSWTDTTGSTYTPVTTDYDLKDIANAEFDDVHNAMRTFDISTGAVSTWLYLWTGSSWVPLGIFAPNSDDVDSSTQALQSKSFLYGYNGSTWDRLKSDVEHYLWTRTSTNSLTGIYYNGWNVEVQSDHEMRVEASTDSKAGIYYNGNVAEVQSDKELRVETSTDSTGSIYYNGVKAVVDAEGNLWVETSSASILNGITNPVTSYITISQFYELSKNATFYLNLSQFKELTVHPTNFITLSQFLELTNASTQYLTLSQFIELSKNATSYIRGGYVDGLLAPVTSYITQSQFLELTKFSTYFLTISQFNELSNNSTAYIKGGFLDSVGIVGGVNQSTSYITTSQFLELTKASTFYLTESQFNELRKGSTLYLSISQFDELTKNSTNYIKGGVLDTVKQVLSIVESTVTPRGGSIDEVKIVKGVEESTSVVKNFPTDYPDTTAQSSLSSIDGHVLICNTKEVVISSCPADSRYANKVSTGTGGLINLTGNISFGYNVIDISLYSVGGSTQATFTSTFTDGINYVFEGIPFSMTPIIPVISPTLQFEIPVGCTVYYSITGVRQ